MLSKSASSSGLLNVLGSSTGSSTAASVEIFNGERLSSFELDMLKQTCRGLCETNTLVKENFLKSLAENQETYINDEDDINVFCGVQIKLKSIHSEYDLKFDGVKIDPVFMVENTIKRIEILKLLYLRDLVAPWVIKVTAVNEKI